MSAQNKKRFGGKVYEPWMTIGKGNTKEFIDKVIKEHKEKGFLVRVVPAPKYEQENGRLAFIYHRRK